MRTQHIVITRVCASWPQSTKFKLSSHLVPPFHTDSSVGFMGGGAVGQLPIGHIGCGVSSVAWEAFAQWGWAWGCTGGRRAGGLPGRWLEAPSCDALNQSGVLGRLSSFPWDQRSICAPIVNPLTQGSTWVRSSLGAQKNRLRNGAWI